MFLIINEKLDRIAKKDTIMQTNKGGANGYSSNKNDYSDDDNNDDDNEDSSEF